MAYQTNVIAYIFWRLLKLLNSKYVENFCVGTNVFRLDWNHVYFTEVNKNIIKMV